MRLGDDDLFSALFQEGDGGLDFRPHAAGGELPFFQVATRLADGHQDVLDGVDQLAGAFKSVDLDFRALPGIYVGIVMGRHAGFLTAAAAAWRRDGEKDGPNLVYVPEAHFSPEKLIADIRAAREANGRCVVAMSEGVATEDGTPLADSLIPEERMVEAKFLAKADGVICGMPVAERVFKLIDARAALEILKNDGQAVQKGEILAILRGPAAAGSHEVALCAGFVALRPRAAHLFERLAHTRRLGP